MKKLTDKLQANEIEFDFMGNGEEETLHFTVGNANFTAFVTEENAIVIECDTTVDGTTQELGNKTFKRLTYLYSFIAEMKYLAFELHESNKETEESITNEHGVTSSQNEINKINHNIEIGNKIYKESQMKETATNIANNTAKHNLSIENIITGEQVERIADVHDWKLADFVYQIVLAYNETDCNGYQIANNVQPIEEPQTTQSINDLFNTYTSNQYYCEVREHNVLEIVVERHNIVITDRGNHFHIWHEDMELEKTDECKLCGIELLKTWLNKTISGGQN